MTFKGESTQVIRKVARKQGMRTLFEDGMIKAMKGQTTLEEVLRITQHEIARRDRRPESREATRSARCSGLVDAASRSLEVGSSRRSPARDARIAGRGPRAVTDANRCRVA